LLCQHQGGIRVYDRRFEIHKRVLAKEGGVVANHFRPAMPGTRR
jgi:hypothetical protein